MLDTLTEVYEERPTGYNHCPHLSQLDGESGEGGQMPAASPAPAHAGPALSEAAGYNSPGCRILPLQDPNSELARNQLTRAPAYTTQSHLSVLLLRPLYAERRSQL